MRILAFGDDYGLPQLIKYLPPGMLVGIVGAEIRPNQLAKLGRLAEGQGVPLLIQPRHTSSAYPTFVEQVRKLKLDLIFVNSYSMLLRPEILANPRLGGVNVHGALLPQYRGANPIQWALLNDETETGVTMHAMTAEFDTGDIIAQQRVPILFEDTWPDVQARIALATEAMFSEALPRLLKGKYTRQPQDESRARHYKRRRPEDGLIDWQQSVLYIYNLVRALVKPHPGAFYYSGTTKVVLDEYLTIPQVAALKYGATGGGQMSKSGNVALTPLVLADMSVMFDWINGCQRMLFNVPYKPVIKGGCRAWFEAIEQRNDLLIFGIRLLETEKLLGFCQLHNINFRHRNAELQIHLGEMSGQDNKDFPEVISLLLDFAFEELNLNRVYLYTFNADVAAIYVYETIGFKCEGVLRQAAKVDGQSTDVMVMGILKEEYAES